MNKSTGVFINTLIMCLDIIVGLYDYNIGKYGFAMVFFFISGVKLGVLINLLFRDND